MPYFEDLAQQMGNQASGGILGMMLGGINDKRQINQQRKLQELQIRGQKDLSDYNYAKQLQMWEATNYGPQVEQMKKAGLNPALMYGMGGGGGTSIGNAGPGVSGGNAPVGGREIQDMMGMGMQLQIMKAQKENIEADTANKQAENPNIPKAGKEIEARTQSLLQGVENAKAQQELTEIQTDISRIDEYIKGKTQNHAIALIQTELISATERMEMLQNEKLISDKTIYDKIAIIKGEMLQKYLQNELIKASTDKTRSDIQVNEQQLKNMSAKIAQDWLQLEYSGTHMNAEQRKIQNDIWVNDLQQSTRLPIDIVEKAIQGIILKELISPKGNSPIRGFHNR